MSKTIASMYKDSLYTELAKVGKSLSSERRLEIMDLLAQSSKTVEEISDESGLSVANTSRHLQVLKKSNLVYSNRKGKFLYYSLASNKVKDLFYLLRDVGDEQLSEIKKIQKDFSSNEHIKNISLEDSSKKIYNENTLFLDVRPESEYKNGHICNAKNIPIDELEYHLNEISKDKYIIVYCRGQLCAYANIASKFLNNHGFNAYSLNSSYYDWEKYVTKKIR